MGISLRRRLLILVTNQVRIRNISLEWAIANEGLIATIEIPSIKANLPIYYGTTNKILSKGVGLMKNGTAIIGGKDTHSVLAGHSGTASKIIFTCQ